MDFGRTERDEKLRTLVADALVDPRVRDALAAVLADPRPEPDVRALYRELGRHRLLASHWPVEYGGLGASHTEAATVITELVAAGVPDMQQVLSVQIVGAFLLAAGSDEQKQRFLPAMAAGERFATVLYTEPGVGSDLASIEATAERDGEDFLLSGVKVYGLKSRMSDLALCAVRTGTGTSRYDGITLFLIDLTADGVTRSNLPTMADEQFDRVELDRVRVGPGAIVGAEGDGWPLLVQCLALERTGLDYSLRARRWYETALAGLDPDETDSALLAGVGRCGAHVDAASLMTSAVLSRMDRQVTDEVMAAMAKYITSETAQQVAVWATEVHGFGYGLRSLSPDDAAVLEAGYREAAGVTLAAGTSQIMLEIVSGSIAAAGSSQEAWPWT
ncbi:acyl-CoA dehydrogenase family protein [Kibdelosporangium persicum]|uniref:Acyl-CoA dehydrogenase n=1 Tax=Kibdelosporangium persicum TaxID=2698649 RepID=A0ABX2FHV3_9PSEU|nr:acyl-CoA dehydrogenase family protein [Kibdelosporangium persicum]NRN70852.1 Acyl-CoA dehydrogenase [Kibdelosporangium persicum]